MFRTNPSERIWRLHAFTGAIVLAGVLAACGGDDADTDEGEDFASQASAICIDAGEEITAINLELGHEQDAQDTIEKVKAVQSVREESYPKLEALEPPSDQADDFDAYLAQRQETIDLVEPQLEALESGDEEEIAATGSAVQASSEKSQELAAELKLTGCDNELPSEDAEAAEDVLREHLTTSDPATSCDPEELVTEAYLEGVLGGAEACEKLQEKGADNPEDLPTDIEVSKTEGTDGTAAFLEFEDVGGKFDGQPATASLYYDDGWKVYAINALE